MVGSSNRALQAAHFIIVYEQKDRVCDTALPLTPKATTHQKEMRWCSPSHPLSSTPNADREASGQKNRPSGEAAYSIPELRIGINEQREERLHPTIVCRF